MPSQAILLVKLVGVQIIVLAVSSNCNLNKGYIWIQIDKNSSMWLLHQTSVFETAPQTLLHNFTVEQLHKKLEFVEYLFRCLYNSTIFLPTECVELKPFD